MRVSATEEPESPHEGTGGAGAVLSRRYWLCVSNSQFSRCIQD